MIWFVDWLTYDMICLPIDLWYDLLTDRSTTSNSLSDPESQWGDRNLLSWSWRQLNWLCSWQWKQPQTEPICWQGIFRTARGDYRRSPRHQTASTTSTRMHGTMKTCALQTNKIITSTKFNINIQEWWDSRRVSVGLWNDLFNKLTSLESDHRDKYFKNKYNCSYIWWENWFLSYRHYRH